MLISTRQVIESDWCARKSPMAMSKHVKSYTTFYHCRRFYPIYSPSLSFHLLTRWALLLAAAPAMGFTFFDGLSYLNNHYPASIGELFMAVSGTSTPGNAFMQAAPSMFLSLSEFPSVRRFLFFGHPNRESRTHRDNILYLLPPQELG